MKHSLHIFALALTLIFLQTGCSSTKIEPNELEGVYEGTFLLINVSKGTEQTGEVELNLKEAGFTCSGNPNQMPAGGSGSYTIKGNTLKFEDNNVYRPGFDHNLILNGEYEYSFDGADLMLWREAAGNQYRYELKKR